MKIFENGKIKVDKEDAKNFMDINFNSNDLPKFFKRHLKRMGINEDGKEIKLNDHHIISREDIKIWLISIFRSITPDDLKAITERYLNDARNEQLRASIKFEKSQGTKDVDILYQSFFFNPNNLVYGPPTGLRKNDPGSWPDYEILADCDKKINLRDPELSMCEKLSMLAKNEKRGVTTWIKDSETKLYYFKEDLDRIGQNVCQWYVKGFDEPEHPKKCIKILDGTLVDCTKSMFTKMMAPIQDFFSSLKKKKFFS